MIADGRCIEPDVRKEIVDYLAWTNKFGGLDSSLELITPIQVNYVTIILFLDCFNHAR